MITFALIQDTFREAMARKIFWGLFALSALLVLFFLFILKIDLVEGATATLSLFGNTSKEQDVRKLVKGVYAGIATFLYTWGMFLAVFASSGLVPSVLEPGRIELLLSKPVRRWHLLLGRYAGNLLLIFANTAFLVLGVWLIMGWKTGIWGAAFLVTIASTVFIFSVLLAVVVLIGVIWESAALATMVTVALMIMSPILAQERNMRKLLSSEWSRQIWKGLYYVLPKVYDTGKMTLDYVFANPFQGWWPVWTSTLFGGLALAVALVIFARRDF